MELVLHRAVNGIVMKLYVRLRTLHLEKAYACGTEAILLVPVIL